MSDTIGSALITIEPDFSKFERELTIGLQKAIAKVQQAAEVTLKLDTQGSVKAVEKDFAGTNNVLQEFNQSQAEIVKGISKTNKSLNQLSTTLTGTKASAQSTLAIIGTLFNILGNIGNVAIAIAGIKNLTLAFLEQRRTVPGVIDQLKLFFRVFSEFAVQTSKTQENFQKTIKVIPRTTNSLDELNKKLRGAGDAQGDFVKRQSFATAQLATQAKTTEVAALATTKLGVETSKTANFFAKFKNESGGINIGLATGANIFNRIREAAVSATGAVASYVKTVKTSAFPKAAVRSSEFILVPALAKKAGESVADYTRRINEAATATGVFSRKGVGVLGNLDLALRKIAGGLNRLGESRSSFATAEAGFTGIKRVVQAVVRSFDDWIEASARIAQTVGGGGPFGFAGAISELSTLATVASTTFAIVAAGSAAFIGIAQKASTAHESINAVSVTLGDASKKFKELIGNSNELGLSTTRLNQAITPIAPLLRNAGLGGDDLAVALNDIVRAGVDLSSVYNVDVDQALGAISAGIRGEIEPLERLGVAFNAAEVEAKALSLGFKKTGGQLEESAKQYSRLQLILDKASIVQGDFKNTSDSVANAQRILQAKMSSTVGVISAAFLPAAQKLLQTFIKLSDENGPKIAAFFTAATPLITKFADLFAALAEITTKTGGILVELLLPVFKGITAALTVISPILQSVLVKFLALGVITTILRTAVAALAAFVPAVFGGALAVNALNAAVLRLAAPLGLLIIGLHLFGVEVADTSNVLLGSLAQVLKFITPLLAALILKGVALKVLPLALGAVSIALRSLSVVLAGALAPALASFGRGLGILLSGPIPLIVAGLFALRSAAEKSSFSFDKLKEAGEESLQSLAKEIEKQAKPGRLERLFDLSSSTVGAFKDNLKNVFKGPFADVDPIEAPGVRANKGDLKELRENFQKAFEIDPEVAALSLRALKGQGSKFAGPIEKEFKKLTKAAQERAKETEEAAKKAAGDEKTYLEVLTDSLSTLTAFENALKGVTSAEKALTSARDRLAQLDEQSVELTKERLRILRDTPSAENEIVAAKDELLSIELQLKDLAQERIDLEEELQELTTPATIDELAEAQDRVLSAQIALNAAKRVQIELEEELSPLQKASIDLSGLTLDQARSRLKAIRASLSAQKAADKPAKKAAKTQEEIDDERVTKEISVREAQRGLTEAVDEESKLKNKVLLNSDEIEKTTRQITANEISTRSAVRDQETAITRIQTLLGGETTLKLALEVIDKQITQLAKDRKEATEAVRDAEKEITKAKDKQREDIALIKGDEETLNKIYEDRVKILGGLPDIAKFRTDLARALADAKTQAEAEIFKTENVPASQAALAEIQRLVGADNTVDNPKIRERITSFLPELLKAALDAAFIDADVPLDLNLILRDDPNFIKELGDKLVKSKDNALIDILKELLFKAGIRITGLKEGGFVPGVPGSFGRLARLGEFGLSELVLPITDTQRSSALLAKYAPEISLEGARKAGAIDSLTSVSSVPIIGPRSNGSNLLSRKPSGTENRLDRLIQLLEERNRQAPEISAPITITEAPDPRYTARRLARELRRRWDNI